MDIIYGIFNRDGKPVPPKQMRPQRETHDHTPIERSGSWSQGPAFLGWQSNTRPPESLDETQPCFHSESRCCVVSNARIDNRKELARQFDIHPESLAETPDSKLILHAYLKWRTRCCGYLIGDFSFAVWDDRIRRIFCGRDRMGCRPFYYYKTPDRFIFSSEINWIHGISDLKLTLNEETLAGFLVDHCGDHTATFDLEINRLPPGHTLTLSSDKSHVKCYWTLNPRKRLRFRDEEDYIKGLKDELENAVARRLNTPFPIGAELSGGLDSSTIVCLSSRLLKSKGRHNELWTASHTLPAPPPPDIGYEDESLYIRHILDQEKISNHILHQDWNTRYMNGLKPYLARYGGPGFNYFGYYSTPMYRKLFNHGIRTLLSGYGGDEGVSNNASVYPNGLVRRLKWHRLLSVYREQGRSPARQMRQILVTVLSELFPSLADRLNSFLYGKTNFKKRFLGSHLVNPEFAENWNVQTRSKKQLYQPVHSLRQHQLNRLSSPFLTKTIEERSQAAAFAGITATFPLLDPSLIQFYLAIPDRIKYGNGRGRYLFRCATAGILPDEINQRYDKTGRTVFIDENMLLKDMDILQAMLKVPEIKRGVSSYLDTNKTERLLETVLSKGFYPYAKAALKKVLATILFIDHRMPGSTLPESLGNVRIPNTIN